MKQKTKGLSYVGDEDLVSRYTYFLEDRRVFDVLVHNGLEVGSAELGEGAEVPEGTTLHRILIARVDAPLDQAQKTKGIAARVARVEEGPEGLGMNKRISGDSIRAYVEPRVAVLLARLFVPAAS